MGRIDINNVTKRFGSEVAVEDLDLSIDDSEFLVLVGPSGCGKSTTLRCIAGLESQSEGDIYIGGEHMNYRTPQNRDIAMVFQDYALYPHMTVRENIRFGVEEDERYAANGGRFGGLSDRLGIGRDGEQLDRADMEQEVEDAAALLGIEDLLDRKPEELSGGQQQRVALGRAIVRDPEVFLMDEPLANLDAQLRSEMRAELQQLQNQLDVTTVYVTHNQTEAMTMGDRIAVLNDGRLQQVGEPLELYHEPANEFVAGFIGEPMMNLLPGRREGSSFVGEHFEYPLDDEIRRAVGDAEDLTLGVRPEDVGVQATDGIGASALDDHEFMMEVSVVEPHGDQNVVHLYSPEDDAETDPSGNSRQAVSDDGRADRSEADEREHDVLQAVVGGMHVVDESETVVVSIDPEDVHVFDGVSGEALHHRRLEAEQEVTQV